MPWRSYTLHFFNPPEFTLVTDQSEIVQLKRLLEQEKGAKLAVERDSYEIKRNAKIAHEQAEALVRETQDSLATAASQMQIAHAISCGIFGMAELGRAFLARKVAAARMTHREQTFCSVLEQLVSSSEKQDQIALKSACEKAKQIVTSVKADGEMNRNKALETALAAGYVGFEKLFAQLVTGAI